MHFGRTGRTADTIAPGTSSQQDDDIARIRSFPDHGFARSRAKHCPNFHSFCCIVRMIDFFYQTCRQPYLISIRTVSVCGLPHQLLLWQFSFHRLFHGNCGIGCPGHAHSLIYVSTSGKRITDCPAQAGCGTAERFDFCWMIMCLILKVHKPLFCFTVNLHRNYNTARIDFIRFLLVLQLSFLFQLPHSHQSQIHQAYKFIISSFEDFFTVSQIFFICSYNRLFIISFTKSYVFQFCGKCSMAAVI